MALTSKGSRFLAVSSLLAGLLLIPQPAQAAPKPAPAKTRSFNWKFTGYCCVNSRTWESTRPGAVMIVSNLAAVQDGVPACYVSGHGLVTYRIGLYRGSKLVSWRNLTCGGLSIWPGEPAGEHHFGLKVIDAAGLKCIGWGNTTYAVKS